MLALVLTASGCANLRLPAIDPSGGRLFLPNPNYTTLANDGFLARLHRGRLRANPNVTPGLGAGQPAIPGSTLGGRPGAVPLPGPYEPALLNRHRDGFSNLLRNTGDRLQRWHEQKQRFFDGMHQQPSIFSPRRRTPATLFGNSAFPRTPLPPDCGPDGNAPANGPCYPVGSPNLASRSYQGSSQNPVGTGLGSGMASPNSRGLNPVLNPGLTNVGPGVVIAQPRYTARVGEEVVVLGGILAKSGIARGGEPVRWTLSNDSVGTIVDAARPAAAKPRLFGLLRPVSAQRKACGTCVDSITSDRCRVVRRSPNRSCRGNTQDDLYLSKGQTWVSLTSGSPGRSYVTLAAPQLSCGKRVVSAIIEWTDATWECPRPVLASLEVAQLITRVFRNSDRQPIPNWNVRYTYIDGPKVQFDNGSADSMDVSTDARGRAILTARPSSTEPGTTRFAIQIFDPDVAAGPVHQCLGFISWSESVPVGGELEYPEEPVEEPTDVGPPYLGDSGLNDEAGLEAPFTPAPGAGAPATGAPRPGDPNPTDNTTRPFATTPPITVPTPQAPERTRLAIRVTPPQDAVVNGTARYQIEVINNGTVPATDVTVVAVEPRRGLRLIQRDVADPFRQGENFGWAIGTLPPGRPVRLAADFQVLDINVPPIEFTADAENAFNPVSDRVETTVIPRNVLRVLVSPPQPYAPEVGQDVAFNVGVQNLIGRELPVRIIVQDWTGGIRPKTDEGQPSPQEGIQLKSALTLAPGAPSQPERLPFETLRPGPQQFTIVAVVDDPNLPRIEPVRQKVYLNVQRPTTPPPATADETSPVSYTIPDGIAAGERGTVRVTIRNVMPAELRDVTMTYRGNADLYPARDANLNARPSADGLTYEWQLGNMAPGQIRTIEVAVEAAERPRQAEGINEIFVQSARYHLGDSRNNQAVPERIRIPILTSRLGRSEYSTRPVGTMSPTSETRYRVESRGLDSRRTASSRSQASLTPRANTLQLRLDAPESVGAGKRFPIVLNLHNANANSYRNVSVTLNLPPDVQILDYRSPPMSGARQTEDGRHLSFGTLREIMPGERLQMKAIAAVRTNQPFTVSAQLEAIGLPKTVFVRQEIDAY